MVVPRISSDEEEPEVSRHALHKDTALQEVTRNDHYKTNIINYKSELVNVCY